MRCVGILFIAVALKIAFACHVVQVHQMAKEFKDSVDPKYWRSNFYLIPKRPPAKGYLPPLLPIQNGFTEVPEALPWTITDFAKALSGCWMQENPSKLHAKLQELWEIQKIWSHGKLWDIPPNITFPTLINSTIAISATVYDNQTMTFNINAKFITNPPEVYGYTLWGKTDNETIGTLQQWKQIHIGKAMNNLPMAFDFEDNILRTYGIMNNSTANPEYKKGLRWSIDPDNPKRLMRENWIHKQSNTNGTINYVKYDCENDTAN